MILGALTVVDGMEIMAEGRQSAERRQMNSDLLCAIFAREDELLKLPYSSTSLLFACLSRFFAQMDGG